MTLRVMSFGAGIQSTAMLVLAAQREIDFPVALFANVGDDSEHPATLRYLREVAMPYAAAHGIELTEVRRTKRDGTTETIYGRLTRTGGASIPIPVYFSGGVPGTRACTSDFKIRVVRRELLRRGASASLPAVVGLGISVDELHRARSASGFPDQTLDYPLLRLRLSRADCAGIIERAGLPLPPKSACYFCPYTSPRRWQEMADDDAALFAEACRLEERINAKRAAAGKDAIFLHRRLLPLAEAVSPHRQLSLLDDQDDACESGYCMV